MVQACNNINSIKCEIATTNQDGKEAVLSPRDIPNNTVCHMFPMIGYGPLQFSPQLVQWVSTNIHKYDLIHFHGLWNRTNSAVAKIARSKAVQYVVRPAGMLSAYSWQRGWFRKRIYWSLIEKATVVNASAIHVTSEQEKNEVMSCVSNIPIVDIPNGLDIFVFDSPQRREWLNKKCGNISRDIPIILYLSRLHPKKGVAEYLIPAFSKMKTRAFLAIAGGIDESTPEYERIIDKAINDFEVVEHVKRIGPVLPGDRYAAYDGATLFCLPSENENFGTVVTEAMARQCPVVVTEGVAAGKYALEANAGKVVPRNIDAIANALDDELSDPTGRIARGERGRAFVKGQLSWDGIANRLVKLYSEILDNSKQNKKA